jgi:hypothetical protein
MIQYHVHEKQIMDAGKAYQTIFDTIKNAEDSLAVELNAYFGSLKERAF